MTTDMNGVAEFQRAAEAKLEQVLAARGVAHTPFHTGGGSPPVRYTTLTHEGREYTVVISDNITMTHGDQLFECYLHSEFADDQKLIDSFAARLDRFLAGQPWN